MRQRPFKQVDVFSAVPFLGNPVAVVFDAADLTTEEMQRIARWTNLSETTFVLPPTDPSADYRVRIFTPGFELPFAGHPTIGTAHALLEAGLIASRDGRLVQECAAGFINLHVNSNADAQTVAFELPKAVLSKLGFEATSELIAALGRESLGGVQTPTMVDVGPKWIVIELVDATAVLELQPDFERLKAHNLKMGATGVVVFGAYGNGARVAVEVRAFAPACGVNEDPICGSGNGAMATLLKETGDARFGEAFVASQGQKVGRAGFVSLRITSTGITVGGAATTCVSGILTA